MVKFADALGPTNQLLRTSPPPDSLHLHQDITILNTYNMPLKLVANSLDHSQCLHNQEGDEEMAEGPLEVTLPYIRYSCVHLIKDAKWKDHQDELRAFLLECKMKGSVADMRRLGEYRPYTATF